MPGAWSLENAEACGGAPRRQRAHCEQNLSEQQRGGNRWESMWLMRYDAPEKLIPGSQPERIWTLSPSRHHDLYSNNHSVPSVV